MIPFNVRSVVFLDRVVFGGVGGFGYSGLGEIWVQFKA